MTLKLSGPLVLVGAGNMGGAMLSGWLDRGLNAADIYVLDPKPSDDLLQLVADTGLHLNPAQKDIPDPALVLLAVKPQMMDVALDGLDDLVRPGAVYLSIAAGKTIPYFEEKLNRPGQDAAIVRSIPNTPAAVGRGITVACANPSVSTDQKAMCTSLLEAIGEVGWVDEEILIDAVTAVSGSGPAYVFYLAECMAKAGEALGLPADLAARLGRVTVEGAGELMHQSSDAPTELRRKVTSPAGTTAAALDVLMGDNGLPDLMEKAIRAAEKRSRDLSG
jgi:pyrroline-5-carboxylate reductase